VGREGWDGMGKEGLDGRNVKQGIVGQGWDEKGGTGLEGRGEMGGMG
jgi:hypothetical protein